MDEQDGATEDPETEDVHDAEEPEEVKVEEEGEAEEIYEERLVEPATPSNANAYGLQLYGEKYLGAAIRPDGFVVLKGRGCTLTATAVGLMHSIPNLYSLDVVRGKDLFDHDFAAIFFPEA